MKRHAWIPGSLFTILTLSAFSMSRAQPNEDVWEERETPMPSQRVSFATSAVNGKIYVIGGTVWNDRPLNGKVVGTVEEYDPRTNKWRHRKNMGIARSYISTSAVDGKIYAIAGSVQAGWWRKHVEAYDPIADTWEKKSDMPVIKHWYSTSVVDGKIYLIGWSNENHSVYAYDPMADVWEQKSDMPNVREGFSTSVVNDVIYVIGGRTWDAEKYLQTVDAYNPATDTWERKAEMPTPRCCMAASTVAGIIYAMGGQGIAHQIHRTVEAYNPITDTWQQRADMPDTRVGFSTNVVDEKIYAFTDSWDFTRTLLVYTPPATTPLSVNAADELATTWGRVKTGR